MRKVIYGLIVFAVMFCWGQPLLAQQPAGELRIGLNTFYDQTFHPTWETVYRRQYFSQMYDCIIGVDKDGNFSSKDSVAYKWETSPDNLTWTFYIRDGIKFHNGDPLTNEDVKYTIEQDASMKNNAGGRTDFVSHVDSVEAIPPDKVLVHLKKPWPTFLHFLSNLTGGGGDVTPKNYILEKGEDNFNAHPVGSGPYKFTEWKENAHIKFVAQDHHWRVGVPKYKYLTFKLMPEEGTRVAALQSGEIDVIPIGIAHVKELKENGFLIKRKKDGLFVGLQFLKYWRTDYPTSKKKVRQALIYAINKDEIVEQILMGQGRVVGCATSMFTWAIEYKPYPHTPYDPKKARQLLAEAGYPNGFTMYIYSFVTKLAETKLIDEAIAAYWEAIGVKVKILDMSYSAFKPVWMNQRDPRGSSSFILAFPNRPVYSWRDIYHSKGGFFSHAKDPTLDIMLDEFEAQITQKSYIAHAQKLMDYVLENAYSTGICTTHELYATSKSVPAWEMGKGVGSYNWEYIK